jgi:hypothetical protein
VASEAAVYAQRTAKIGVSSEIVKWMGAQGALSLGHNGEVRAAEAGSRSSNASRAAVALTSP